MGSLDGLNGIRGSWIGSIIGSRERLVVQIRFGAIEIVGAAFLKLVGRTGSVLRYRGLEDRADPPYLRKGYLVLVDYLYRLRRVQRARLFVCPYS